MERSVLSLTKPHKTMEKRNFKVKVNKVSVIYRTFLFFFGFLVILVSLGFAPKGVKEINNAFFSIFIHDERSSVNEGDLVETVRFGSYTEPARIVIPKIGVDAKVLNPKSSDTKTLDDALLYGAVRYPESGDLESSQTIFIFGHSSHLPIVHNQNFKLFSEIPKLSPRSEIKLYSENGKEYTYSVDTVTLTKAEDALVNLSERKRKLVVSTCNGFGEKSERYVVVASFVGATSTKQTLK